MLDGDSRFKLVLSACTNTQAEFVQRHLRAAFEHYGLHADNGTPWGSPTSLGQPTG